LRYPNLYAPGHLNLLFNKKVFAQSVAEGVITSLVLFFVTYGTFQEAVQDNGVDLSGYQAFGTVVASSLVVVVTLRVSIMKCLCTNKNTRYC
jgi:phospholipid-translocating ATPase